MEETHTFVPVYSPPLEMLVQLCALQTQSPSSLQKERTYAYLVLVHLPHSEKPTPSPTNQSQSATFIISKIRVQLSDTLPYRIFVYMLTHPSIPPPPPICMYMYIYILSIPVGLLAVGICKKKSLKRAFFFPVSHLVREDSGEGWLFDCSICLFFCLFVYLSV